MLLLLLLHFFANLQMFECMTDICYIKIKEPYLFKNKYFAKVTVIK